MASARETLETILRERFQPLHLELRDESASHAGHPGAASGGGHFRVVIVSEAFQGQALLDRHRRVNEALAGMFGREIHALALRTLAPSEWTSTPSGPTIPAGECAGEENPPEGFSPGGKR